ncbi:flavin reductase [Alteromonas sp. ASW11-19]|uniref:Flavin reductase n=2 Tax=Alteromonas salexigens TaxID=2982530 RepID=A0ABT2VJP9_9ALTE|nr:flavin reductase [Alteromonas salexigens]MCU7553480.1 flavin reductase [Alteromonas salexigens]
MPENFDAMPQRFRANFINSLSGVKAANVIGTRSEAAENLAIISSVFHVGANPPLLGMLMRPHTVVRDTLENILQSGVYTINHVGSEWVDKAHHTSARFDADVSEFAQCGLTSWYSESHAAPYVQESRVKIGLRLSQHLTLENKTVLVIGHIQEVILANNTVAEDGYVDIEALGSAAITGLDSYHSTTRLARFEYAKPDTPVAVK